MNTRIAFGLIGISSDLAILEAHLELIEEQEEGMRQLAEDIRHDLLENKSSFDQDDRQAWSQFAEGVYDDYVEFRLPRIVYYPFLVSLYVVYESAVTEIASLVQEKSGTDESLANTKGKDFLDRANKFFRITLKYELSQSNQTWERMRILTEIRNAIAHANGHLELVRKGKREQIKKWIDQDIGIEDYYGDIIISGEFVRKTYEMVKGDLESLIERFKGWNSTAKVQ
jgi:hypothetical protein